MVGQKLGHYKILEKLGEGGMGVVYRALDSQLKREVAIKVLPEQADQDPRRLARFEREALLLASLSHPNIVSIHSVEKADGVPFIVMELVHGEPLSEAIPPKGMEIESFLALAVQLADALGAAHAHGIQHRDIKPSNIMLATDGTIKIADFGLARFLNPEPESMRSDDRTPTQFGTRDGTVLGTAAYMSPEQAEGKETDSRSDIFSLGIVMYELATGRRPFEGDSHAALISSILRDTPSPVNEVKPDTPRHLSRLINQCLAKDPNLRFQIAQDLRNSLVELQDEVKSGEAWVEPPPKPTYLSRKARVTAIAAFALIVLVLLMAVPKLLRWGADEEPVSVAVLPLKNLSLAPGNDYIGEGVTEDIIARLSMFPDLTVISSTSVMRFSDSQQPTAEIGRVLGVTHLLEGSLRRDGDDVRIVSRLVDATSERAVWAATFDRNMQNLFALQSEVALDIATALKGRLTKPEEDRLNRTPPEWETHDLYLRGRHFLGQRTEQGMRTALELFQQATDREPDYAAAWAATAETFSLLGIFGLTPTPEAHAQAFAAAERALAIDPESADAHHALGVAAFNRWDWATAETALGRALELNPNLARAHHYYSYFLVTRGRTDEAIHHILMARRLDPASPTTQLAVGAVYFLGRQFQPAIEHIQAAIEMYPESARAHAALAGVYAFAGSQEHALMELDEALNLSDESPEIAATQITVLALTDNTDRARTILEAGLGESTPRRIMPGDAASAYAILGDTEEALKWLEVGYGERDPVLAYLAVDPGFDTLRSNPDFVDLLERVGLDQRRIE